MSLNAEALVDRRRLQRHLSFWRIAALVVLLSLVVYAAAVVGNTAIGTSHIARVDIAGMITNNRAQMNLFEKLEKADEVKAVIIHINSPGGTTAGGEALYLSIRKLGKKKPVIAVFGTMATSAAYITGLATDRIVARGNTITGSVGVIMQWTEFTGLLNNLGVKMNEIKSGHLKANPSPFQPLDEAGKAATEEIIADTHKWFVDLVRDRRKIDPSSVPGLTDGKIFSGRQALLHKLIDEIGGEEKAIEWLESKHKLPKDLEVKNWTVQKADSFGLFGNAAASIAKKMGIPVDIFNKNHGLERLRLDGLVSVWHPNIK